MHRNHSPTPLHLCPRLTQIGKEVFLNCVVLQEVVIPTELSDIGIRAFCGCEQLQRFTPLDWGDIEQCVQAEHNAFFMCDKFEKPLWVCLLYTSPSPRDGLLSRMPSSA